MKGKKSLKIDDINQRDGLILIDNNIASAIAYSLRELNEIFDNNIKILTVNDCFYDGVTDLEMFSKLGKGSLIVSCDSFHHRGERKTICENQISWLYIPNKKKKIKTLDIILILLKNWDIITNIKRFPIYYKNTSGTKLEKIENLCD